MKKSGLRLFAAVFELIIGISAVISFIFIIISGTENILKWIPAFLLALVFIVMGAVGIIAWKKGE